jgi:hypothetical protein
MALKVDRASGIFQTSMKCDSFKQKIKKQQACAEKDYRIRKERPDHKQADSKPSDKSSSRGKLQDLRSSLEWSSGNRSVFQDIPNNSFRRKFLACSGIQKDYSMP